jgi:flagellar biosynthesis/type III secretory pathway protein FliH
MEMTWAERMEAEYTRKGLEQGLEKGMAQGLDALRSVVLRLLRHRFGAVPASVQSKVEAIDEMEPLSDLAERVLEIDSIEEMGLG